MWTAAAFGPPVVAGLLSLGRPVVQDSHAILALVLVVAVISASGRSMAGIAAAFTAALIYDYAWTEPYGSLAIHDVSDVITVALLLVVAVATGPFTRWAVQQQSTAAQQRNYLTAVETADAASTNDAPDSSLDAVCDSIAAVLGADRCRLVRSGASGTNRLHPDGSVTQGDRVIDVDRAGLPTDDVIVVPIGGVSEAVARFEVTASSRIARPSLEQRQVAALVARLAGAGLPTLR